jgi:hypothetical protein
MYLDLTISFWYISFVELPFINEHLVTIPVGIN